MEQKCGCVHEYEQNWIKYTYCFSAWIFGRRDQVVLNGHLRAQVTKKSWVQWRGTFKGSSEKSWCVYNPSLEGRRSSHRTRTLLSWAFPAGRLKGGGGLICNWVELRILSCTSYLASCLMRSRTREDGSNLDESTNRLARQSYAAAGFVEFYDCIVCSSRYMTAMAMNVL